jgi:rod shape-determining protein MreB
MLAKKIGIDLGTERVRMAVRGEGLVLNEPTVVSPGPRRFGRAAIDAGVELVRPMSGGAVADAAALDTLLGLLLNRAVGRQRIFRPDVMIAVGALMSGTDRRGILDALARHGARTSYLIDAPLAAAIGAGLRVAGPAGHLVVDIGAGSTQAAVVAMESLMALRVIPHGGAALTAAVAAAVARHHGLTISTDVADEVKRELGPVTGGREEMLVNGRRDGDSVSVKVNRELLRPLIQDHASAIAMAIGAVVDEAPPALRSQLVHGGALLTGGGALLPGLTAEISMLSGLTVAVARDPQGSTAAGTAQALDHLDVVRRSFLYVR